MDDSVEAPPIKKIKFGQEFIELIEDCYETLFNNDQRSDEEQARLDDNIAKICETLEQVQSSDDVAFGPNRARARITWAKCLYLLLESGGSKRLRPLNVLTGPLKPGFGMFM